MTAQTILPANTLSSGYDVANSYMFGGDANTSITNTTPTNTKIFTISLWIKLHEFPTSGGDRIIYGYYSADNTQAYLYLRNDFTLGFYEVDSGTSKIDFRTTQFFRDPTAWYHIVVAIDTSQGTDTNRFKLYVNGSQVSAFNANSYPDQNYASMLNENSLAFNVGGTGFSSDKIHASICEFVFIDGSQLAPTSFGEFDSDTPNTWKPKSVSGLTFGNNGFYLEFKATGTSANSSGAGADTSGNDRHHSVTNLAAADQRVDTCTNNFATLNPLERSPNAITFTDGNTTASGTSGNSGRFTGGTYSPRKGKWWCELKVTVSGSYPIFGAIDADSNMKFDGTYFVGSESAPYQSGFAAFSNADVYHNDDNNYGNWQTYSTNDIIGMGIDMDASPPTLTFVKNGSNEETFNMETPNSGHYTFPAVGLYMAAAIAYFNFGSPPYAISSGNADQNGYGNFEYAPKTNYYSMCSKNIAEFG